MLFGLGINSAWLRVLRLFRVGKIVSTHKGTGILSGFTGVVLIISAGIISAKVLILILESYGYIPVFDNISLVLGLVSFSLAMLLGTKLSVVNGRLNQLEDAITRIVAGIKVFWFTDISSRKYLQSWVKEFYKSLKNPYTRICFKYEKKLQMLFMRVLVKMVLTQILLAFQEM